jgi:S-formylglutathione hydrolase FrmB
MDMSGLRRCAAALLCVALGFVTACNEDRKESQADHPRLSAQVKMQDVTFHSSALNREMQYRVILPAVLPTNRTQPVIYLLHGGGGGFHDWSNYSDVAQIAEQGAVLVMPEGDNSYYTNSAEQPQDRYEDYVVNDLISDVQSKFPVAVGRQYRAIVGVSMGGYGAIKLALRHPELFSFAGGLSPAVDVPSRPFSIKRPLQWRFHRSIFGPSGSQTRHDNDPFVLARSANPEKTPYLYLACGDQEGLLPANRAFADLLAQRHIPYEFHVVAGGHDWDQWGKSASAMFKILLEHIQKRN